MTEKPAEDTYHHGDLRNALLAAAESLLCEHGPGGLSLREVARAAGVSHTAPYRHFKSKTALLQALAQRGFERLHGAMTQAAAGVPHGPEQQLIAAGIAYVKLAVNNPEVTQLMFGGGVEMLPNGGGQEAFDALLVIIGSGIAAGVFRQREARELALVAWTSMHGLAMLIAAGLLDVDSTDPPALEAMIASVASNVIYGISR